MKPTLYTLLLLTLLSYGCKKDPVLNPGPTSARSLHNTTLDEVKKPPPPSPNDPIKQLGSGD